MSFKKDETTNQLLQVAYPDLYQKLIEFLLAFNIHSYDIRATCRPIGDNIEIQIMYGSGFLQESTKVFPKTIEKDSESFEAYCEEIGEVCKETLIADYFKMVCP